MKKKQKKKTFNNEHADAIDTVIFAFWLCRCVADAIVLGFDWYRRRNRKRTYPAEKETDLIFFFWD
jgi:hypothetical protein